MKQPELTFQTLLTALRRRWKSYLAIVLVCTALGGAAGLWYAPKAAVPGGWEAQPLRAVDISYVREAADYYSDCQTLLLAAYQNAETYLSVLAEAVASAGETPEAEAEKEALGALRIELNTLLEEDCAPISQALGNITRLYLPADVVQSEVRRYEGLLETARLNLLQAEAATELIRSMDAPDASDESINSVYYQLLSSANQYVQLQRQIPLYEEALRQLQEDQEQLAENRREMDTMLSTAVSHLDTFQADLLETAKSIAREYSLRLEVKYGLSGTENEHVAEIILLHTHRASDSREVFAAMTVFFALLGICGGSFLVICQELRSEKKKE